MTTGCFSTISVCINEQHTLKQLYELPIVSVSFKKVICCGHWCAHHVPAPLPSIGSIFHHIHLCFPQGTSITNQSRIVQTRRHLLQRTVFFFFSEFAEMACMHIAKSKNTPQTLNSLPALTHGCVIPKDSQGNYIICHN